MRNYGPQFAHQKTQTQIFNISHHPRSKLQVDLWFIFSKN